MDARATTLGRARPGNGGAGRLGPAPSLWPGWVFLPGDKTFSLRTLDVFSAHPRLEFSDSVIAARAEAHGAQFATFDERLASMPLVDRWTFTEDGSRARRTTITIRRKAFAYVTSGTRLLLFTHPEAPEAGIQIPAGTMAPGRTPPPRRCARPVRRAG